MNHVIAVAASIGGGKTSLVKAIADKLGDSTTIHFDSYEKATKEPVDNLIQWLKNGANFDDFIIPGLPKDLEKLKRGETIIDPITDREITSKKYIIFEMPLGKEHKYTAEYIDLLIWIEVPLDIALARKVKEYIDFFLTKHKKEMYEDRMIWLGQFLDNYLKVTRDVLQIQKEKVSANADIIIDGQKDFDTIVQYATEEILNRLTM